MFGTGAWDNLHIAPLQQSALPQQSIPLQQQAPVQQSAPQQQSWAAASGQYVAGAAGNAQHLPQAQLVALHTLQQVTF